MESILVHSLFLNLIQVYAPFFPGVTNHWFKELGYEGQTIHRTHRLYCPIIYASKIHLSNKPPEIQGFLQVLHALRRHRTNKQLRWSELILEIQIDQRYRSSLLEFVPALKILGRTSQIRFVDHLPLETVLEELRVDVQMIRQSFEPTEAGMILSMIKQADLKTFQFTTENELIIPGSTLKVPSTMFEKRYGTIGEQPKEIEIFELGPYGYLRIEAS